MPRYWAELNGAEVVRVVVCDDPAWLESRLGGTWVETFKADEVVRYCGPGFGFDEAWAQRFAPPWRQPLGADVEDASPYGAGAVVYHAGELWTSTVAANVWEPGVTGWRPVPTDGGPPRWIQPLGAHDSYRIFQTDDGPQPEHVTHNGAVWVTTVDANVWEPGVVAGVWEQVPE